MVDLTDNHEFQLWADSEEQWEHRSDFEALEQKVWVRDEDAALNDYEPHDGALFLATDTEVVYLGDGNSWIPKWNLGDIGSGDGDHTTVEGVSSIRRHVGPFPQDTYHANPGLWGIAFEADANFPIQSVVVDFNSAESTTSDAVVSLYESETTNTGDENQPQPVVPSGMTESEALIGDVSLTLSDGPQRIDLGLTTPSSPATGEFFLGVGPATSGEEISCRRILNWTGWDDYSDSDMNLRYSGRWNNTTNGDFSDNYYRMFDIEIGDVEPRVTSPWSHDVDEIYMRPRDPEEEFDYISPRALWIDTSQ